MLYDDTGLAAWSPFGGGINMPTLQKLADRGLRYSQWHTTALCSPTRSTLLTGRNHHLNGMAAITEGANGFPGANGRVPLECATMPQILQDNGWSTFWLGKDHNVPEQDIASGATRKQWPLQQGFDRFYGFLGGETNQWYPDLVDDNKFIDQPYSPEEGYHLSRDLADQALRMLGDHHATNPSRPWYMWFCPGANHAPHHCPQDYIDKYKGKFDDGYEAYRESVLPRMIEKGILPKGTALTPLNPLPVDVSNASDMVRPWDSLNADEKKLFSRLMEVYAGFSEYTDAQVGRIIDYLERTGQLDNTVVIYAADNGASGEGSPNGSVNENKFFNGYPDELAENLKLIDRLGGPDTYEHYPTGWAAATSTPFKMFKRYSEYAGGTCDPLVISWPKGIKARGEVRNQYHHSTDIVPTILDICGLEMPKVYRGVEQYPLSGVSMRYSFDAPAAPTAEEAAVLRDARHARHVGGRLEGGRDARPDLGQGPSRQGRVGAVPRRRRSRRIEEPGQGAARETAGAHQGLVRRGRQEPGAADRRPHRARAAQHRASIGRSRRANATSTIRARRRCRRASRSTCAAGRTRSSPTSRSPIRTARGSSSRTAHASAATRCSSRTRSCTTSTTSSASRRNSSSSDRS